MNDELTELTISLDLSVLYALIDPESTLADTATAQKLGLLTKKNELSAMGAIVLAGADQTHLRHKIYLSRRPPQPLVPEE